MSNLVENMDYDANVKLRVELKELINFTPEYEANFRKLVRAYKLVINSEEFKHLVINNRYPYYYKKWFLGRWHYRMRCGFHDTDHSGSTVHARIMSGKDHGGIADGDLEYTLELYYKNNGTIAYTYPSVSKIWLNKKFFVHNLKSRDGRAAIMATLMHESCHNLGYRHDRKRTKMRKYSVPYQVGAHVKTVARKDYVTVAGEKYSLDY